MIPALNYLMQEDHGALIRSQSAVRQRQNIHRQNDEKNLAHNFILRVVKKVKVP